MAQPYIPRRRSAYSVWVPHSIHDKFVRQLLAAVNRGVAHKSAIATFNTDVRQSQKDLFTSALTQVGEFYAKWADAESIVKNWEDFLFLLDGIVESPPPFYKAEINGVTIGEPIGVPLYLILDLISNTSAAYTLLTDPDFNKALKKLLNTWGGYLKSGPSNSTLNENEWFSEQGLAVLESGLGGKKFNDTYKTDSSTYPNYAFTAPDGLVISQVDTSTIPIAMKATHSR